VDKITPTISNSKPRRSKPTHLILLSI